MAQPFDLGAEQEHEEGGQKCPQDAVGQIVHGVNLARIGAIVRT